jgi:hypothetical protein
MESEAQPKLVRAIAMFCLLAGLVVIVTNLLSGLSVARSIGRGIVPLAVGGLVLATVAWRGRWKPKGPEQGDGEG